MTFGDPTFGPSVMLLPSIPGLVDAPTYLARWTELRPGPTCAVVQVRPPPRGSALAKLGQARGELQAGFSEPGLSERAGKLAERITANLSFLGKVRGKLSVENVVDMVENARRRIIDQGRHDDGVARLYRAVEMYHQWRLQEHNSVSTKDVGWEKVPEGTRTSFLEAARLPELPRDLDLTRARALDRVLNGEVAEDDNVFRNLLQQRNNSILAHGLEPIGAGSAEKFLEYVDAMVDRPEIRAVAEHARLAGS